MKIGEFGTWARGLARLMEKSCPLALAVIPALADATLRPMLAAQGDVSVLQHGFDHINDGPAERPTQFAPHRPVDEVVARVKDGADRLADLPGWTPVYVPPWNRLEDNVLQALPLAGLRGLSAFGQSRSRSAALVRCDAHVDILRWRGRARFGGALRATDRLRRALESRRKAQLWEDPVGILTHHRVHDAAAWNFLGRLVGWRVLNERVRWCSAQELFAAVPGLDDGPRGASVPDGPTRR